MTRDRSGFLLARFRFRANAAKLVSINQVGSSWTRIYPKLAQLRSAMLRPVWLQIGRGEAGAKLTEIDPKLGQVRPQVLRILNELGQNWTRCVASRMSSQAVGPILHEGPHVKTYEHTSWLRTFRDSRGPTGLTVWEAAPRTRDAPRMPQATTLASATGGPEAAFKCIQVV